MNTPASSLSIVRLVVSVLLPFFFATACTTTPALSDDDAGRPPDGGVVDSASRQDSGLADAANEDTRDGSLSSDAPAIVQEGEIPLRVVADRGGATDARVSVAVPFPPGSLADPARLRLLESDGDERASAVEVLARWPVDASIRSALIVFRTTLDDGAEEELRVEYGTSRDETLSDTVSPSLDGNIVAILDTAWLARSRVSGPLVPAAENTRFAEFDDEVTSRLSSMDPDYESYGVSCSSTSRHRSYYDSPHAMWFHYLRSATPENYRRARVESNWYRENELDWYDGREFAVQVCQGDGWTPSEPLSWVVLRTMTGGGMLDDYLLTGDPAAREAVAGLGRAFVQNLPALRNARENILRVTERNLAWTLMGVAAYYAIEPTEEVRSALDSLISEAIDWQGEGSSGAFEHDIVRPDPDECGDGPNGGSPFMTSLLIDGLMDAYALTHDERIPSVVLRSAEWFRDSAPTARGDEFQYLWGCSDFDYAGDEYAGDYGGLNTLIVHVFGAAFELSGDDAWLEVGDGFADAGIEAMFVGRPKQWNQTVRGFARYIGYRAEGRAP